MRISTMDFSKAIKKFVVIFLNFVERYKPTKFEMLAFRDGYIHGLPDDDRKELECFLVDYMYDRENKVWIPYDDAHRDVSGLIKVKYS